MLYKTITYFLTYINDKNMKNISINSLLLVFVMMVSLSSCDVAGDIFEAGAWTAILGVISG